MINKFLGVQMSIIKFSNNSSLSTAIEKAASGDTIQLPSGNYVLNEFVIDKAISIEGISKDNPVIIEGNILVDSTKCSFLNINFKPKDTKKEVLRIDNEGIVTLEKCIFDCIPTSQNSISVTNKSCLKISNTRFEKIEKSSIVIYIIDSIINIIDSLFLNINGTVVNASGKSSIEINGKFVNIVNRYNQSIEI